MRHDAQIKAMVKEIGRSSVNVSLCKSIITARKTLTREFGSLCSDPASDMLLDLYRRENQGLKTSLTSLWRATPASEMTARHCLAVMEERGDFHHTRWST
ncbi:hypothetical protein [Sphingomonas sp. IW22]|jgi:hypothetical protein|uniref:hypothetical protein n=1 Tax=Sphingomonas sp. IW22 TaxID=3242489 RepID=UPI00351FCC53